MIESGLEVKTQLEATGLLFIGFFHTLEGVRLSSDLARGLSHEKRQTTAGLEWLSAGGARPGEPATPHPGRRRHASGESTPPQGDSSSLLNTLPDEDNGRFAMDFPGGSRLCRPSVIPGLALPLHLQSFTAHRCSPSPGTRPPPKSIIKAQVGREDPTVPKASSSL